MHADDPKHYSLSVLEISRGKLVYNLEVLKKRLRAGTRIMAVVKADAYGHGAVEVARSIRDHVYGFAVNDVDEGIELREGGIRRPILVFGIPTADTAPAYTKYNLAATVSAPGHFDILEKGTHFHLNIDTGMRRLGFDYKQVSELDNLLKSYGDLTCEGIYSHFATAEDPGSDLARHQIERFDAVRSRFPDEWITHMGNTGGAVFYPDAHYDMVRIGIGMYGYRPGETEIEELKPVLRWRSTLAQVKKIKKGDTVSYGARWTCPQDGYTGVIPAGYEEGIPKILTGDLEVAVEGERVPVVGAVTMNYTMAYFENMKPETGMQVEILGSGALNARTWAKRAGTIPYEILTGLSGRLPRKYLDD